jgi:inorganic pyrophosphatase
MANAHDRFAQLRPVDVQTGLLNVIVETPKQSTCKNDYDRELGLFRIVKGLPLGMHFPYDFGFLPGTLGGDGDPLDALVMSQHPTFVGCLVPARLIGVLEAEQTDRKGKDMSRNDRLIAMVDFNADDLQAGSVKQLNPNLLHEIEEFFISYNHLEGKTFHPLGWYGPKRANQLLTDGIRQFRNKK